MASDLSQDVQDFARFFREKGLGWIADQLTTVIQQGRSETKPIKERRVKRKGVTTRPFTWAEQDEILLDLVDSYFVALPQLLPEAIQTLNAAIKQKDHNGPPNPVGIVLRELESAADVPLYSKDVATEVAKLKMLLATARKHQQ